MESIPDVGSVYVKAVLRAWWSVYSQSVSDSLANLGGEFTAQSVSDSLANLGLSPLVP